MMTVELLEIGDYFQLPRLGLILAPDFLLPRTGWSDFSSDAIVVLPDGSQISTTAKFSRTHYLIKDPTVPVENRWRVTVSLPDLTKRDVPVGSRVLVSPETAARVTPGAA